MFYFSALSSASSTVSGQSTGKRRWGGGRKIPMTPERAKQIMEDLTAPFEMEDNDNDDSLNNSNSLLSDSKVEVEEEENEMEKGEDLAFDSTDPRYWLRKFYDALLKVNGIDPFMKLPSKV